MTALYDNLVQERLLHGKCIADRDALVRALEEIHSIICNNDPWQANNKALPVIHAALAVIRGDGNSEAGGRT